MMKLPNLAGFEGLIDLDRRGVDIRPTLLRVLTDQYLHRRAHTLDETDVPARATVASRLAAQACAPRAIILRLARDVLTVAEPILRLSPQLAAADLDAIARERGGDYAAIIATRTAAQLAPSLAAHPTSTPASAAASAPPPRQPAMPPAKSPAKSPNKIDSSTAAIAPQASNPATKPAIEPKELCGLFFAASPIERRYILISLEFLPTPPPALPAAMQQIDIWRFESAALQHKTEAVVRELERALGISRKTALRILEDDMGEPIVAAAKAMELPTDVLQRILLFMNPRVGQSVDRVYELANLYADISTDAAHRLIGIWRDADPPDARTPKHLALWQDAVEQARTALSDITRRAPVPRREAPAIRPGERALGTDRR
jgi:hypothetical protein